MVLSGLLTALLIWMMSKSVEPVKQSEKASHVTVSGSNEIVIDVKLDQTELILPIKVHAKADVVEVPLDIIATKPPPIRLPVELITNIVRSAAVQSPKKQDPVLPVKKKEAPKIYGPLTETEMIIENSEAIPPPKVK